MSEKIGFLKKLVKNRVWQVVVFLVLEVVVLGIYFVGGKWAKEEGRKDTVNNMPTVVDYNIISGLENVEYNSGKVLFSGWVVRAKSENIEIDVVLQPLNGSEPQVLSADIEDRADVVDYLGLEKTYMRYGFDTCIKENRLEEDVCYEVLISLLYEEVISGENVTSRKKISLNQYIYDGAIYRYNPKEFVEPSIVGNDIEEEIQKGTLYSYNSENATWVYLTDDKVYYVADAEKMIPFEKSPSVPIRFYFFEGTTEVKESYSEEKYLKEEDCIGEGNNKYYVVSFELPDDDLTYIRTGTYANKGKGWLFQEIFQKEMGVN